jgi:hypothetical protein
MSLDPVRLGCAALLAPLLFAAAPAQAQDLTAVSCGNNYYDADFDDLVVPEDNDCAAAAYFNIAPCSAPTANPSPDRILNFSSPTDAWVEINASWGRVDMNFYLLTAACGNVLSCATGYGGNLALTGYFTASAGVSYNVNFDSPGGGGLGVGGPFASQQLDVDFICCFDNDGDGLYDMAACNFGPAAQTDCDDTDPNNFRGTRRSATARTTTATGSPTTGSSARRCSARTASTTTGTAPSTASTPTAPAPRPAATSTTTAGTARCAPGPTATTETPRSTRARSRSPATA